MIPLKTCKRMTLQNVQSTEKSNKLLICLGDLISLLYSKTSEFSLPSLEMHNTCTVIPRSIPSVKLPRAAKGFFVDSEDTLTTQP